MCVYYLYVLCVRTCVGTCVYIYTVHMYVATVWCMHVCAISCLCILVYTACNYYCVCSTYVCLYICVYVCMCIICIITCVCFLCTPQLHVVHVCIWCIYMLCKCMCVHMHVCVCACVWCLCMCVCSHEHPYLCTT